MSDMIIWCWNAETSLYDLDDTELWMIRNCTEVNVGPSGMRSGRVYGYPLCLDCREDAYYAYLGITVFRRAREISFVLSRGEEMRCAVGSINIIIARRVSKKHAFSSW